MQFIIAERTASVPQRTSIFAYWLAEPASHAFALGFEGACPAIGCPSQELSHACAAVQRRWAEHVPGRAAPGVLGFDVGEALACEHAVGVVQNLLFLGYTGARKRPAR